MEEMHARSLKKLDPATFRKIVETAAHPVICTDSDGVVRYANPSVARVFGYTAAELLDTSITAIIPQWQEGLESSAPGSALPAPGCAQMREMRGLDRHGRTLPLDLSICVDSGGETAFLTGIRNLQEQRQREKVSEVLLSLGQQLISALTLRQIASVILDAADSLFTWDSAFIIRYSEDDQQYLSVLTYDMVDGSRTELTNPYATIVPGSNTDRTLRSGPQLVLRDGEGNPGERVVKIGADRLSASLMYVPIRKDGRNVGVVSIQSYQAHLYSIESLRILQALADYCGAAFEKAYALAKAAETERALLESRERFELATRATRDIIYDWDFAKDEVWWNDCFDSVFGYGEDEKPLSREAWLQLMPPDDRESVTTSFRVAVSARSETWTAEYRLRRKDGRYAHIFERGYIVYGSDAPARMIGSLMDITVQKQREKALEQGALYDPLTGLLNRAAFQERIQRTGEESGEECVTVLFVDLDGFKGVNDTWGHAAGDEVLVQVGRRIHDCIRPGDHAARLGGDEFTVLLRTRTPEEAQGVADRILEEISLPFTVYESLVSIGASIGIAVTRAGKSPEGLLTAADQAMYAAKSCGKGRCHLRVL